MALAAKTGVKIKQLTLIRGVYASALAASDSLLTQPIHQYFDKQIPFTELLNLGSQRSPAELNESTVLAASS